MSLYHLAVAAHLVGALIWLGGAFSFALVEAPVLRRIEPPALRAELFHRIGVAFRWVGWVAVVMLIVSGISILHQRGILDVELLSDPAFWNSAFGRRLAIKLTLVATMIFIALLHDLVCGPRATQATPGDPQAERYRKLAAWLARINLVLGLLLVFVVVRLVRGG